MAVAGGKVEDNQHWLKIEWDENMEKKLYRDWGIYYSRRQMDSTAMDYYNKAMDLDASDYKTLHNRCLTHKKAARTESALDDARKAAELATILRGPNVNINMEICNELFELNQFEKSECELSNNLRIFKGNEAKAFETRLNVVDDVIKDVTGKAMSIIIRNQKLIQQADEIHKANAIRDERSLWKRLRDQGKCDVLSIPEVKGVMLSPLEIARRQRAFNVVHQTYMNDSWYDIYFMKQLRKNPALLLEQCQLSKEITKSLSVIQYDIVRKFMKMLQSRSPLYLVNYQKYPNKQKLEKTKEAFLFRVQAQTQRNMIRDLRQIRKMRREKKSKELSDYVEKVMGSYYVKKTNRVMCWKFEFLNEVYNTLALALADQYYVPKNAYNGPYSMHQLLRLPRVDIKDISNFVFGDRSTHQAGNEQDADGKKFRKIFAHFEQRIRFSKIHIEKSYLYHQVASTHLLQGHYDECCFNARIAIKESKECNSLIWHFLSIILILKSNVLQHKLEQTGETLELGIPIVEGLGSPRLIRFIDTCISLNAEEFAKRSTRLSSRQSKSSRAS